MNFLFLRINLSDCLLNEWLMNMYKWQKKILSSMKGDSEYQKSLYFQIQVNGIIP